MPVYRVTDEDGYSVREYSTTPPEVGQDGRRGQWAVSADDAATMWAAEMWSHSDYLSEMECIVTRPDGTTVAMTVTVESEPVFSAWEK